MGIDFGKQFQNQYGRNAFTTLAQSQQQPSNSQSDDIKTPENCIDKDVNQLSVDFQRSIKFDKEINHQHHQQQQSVISLDFIIN